MLKIIPSPKNTPNPPPLALYPLLSFNLPKHVMPLDLQNIFILLVNILHPFSSKINHPDCIWSGHISAKQLSSQLVLKLKVAVLQ
jgi:hypothetical protein